MSTKAKKKSSGVLQVAIVVFIAAVSTHQWTIALGAAVPIAFKGGFKSAVRFSGVLMVIPGLRRVFRGVF